MTALGVDGPNIQDRELILLKVVGVLDVGGCGAMRQHHLKHRPLTQLRLHLDIPPMP